MSLARQTKKKGTRRINMWLMGLGMCYFVVLSPSGYHVTIEPYDAVYTTQSLLQSLISFWHDKVLPAFEERDSMDKGKLYIGWLPNAKRRLESIKGSNWRF